MADEKALDRARQIGKTWATNKRAWADAEAQLQRSFSISNPGQVSELLSAAQQGFQAVAGTPPTPPETAPPTPEPQPAPEPPEPSTEE